ncbi:MAG: NAD(P)-dependent oxidoreductase [Bacteroidaceae bacterium]|nr:NAD(P)-dependent oxidoreductase [Bacteroidaceae bacterium]
MNVLITGASGFIGSFLCEESLRRGFSTWAALRSTSSKRWLQYEGLQFIELDLTNPKTLNSQLLPLKGVGGASHWDVVIHAAGATKCLKAEDFDFHNYQCTRNLVEALMTANMMPRQFIYLSSLSATYGSTYGNSKLKTEQWLHETLDGSKTGLTVFRPTGVYGPREKDYFMMAKSIKQHVDFAVGFAPQVLTFVYVKDLVGAIMAAVERGVMDGTFNVTDGGEYPSRAFSDLIQKEMGVKHVVHITAPLWVLKVVSVIAEEFGKLTGKPSTLNRDKYKMMAQRDWRCDISPMIEVLGYQPQWQLPRGVKETIAWYKSQNWI